MNGVFVKVNQIKVCISDDDGKPGKPMYVACNVKNLRIDEFHSLKYDSIKPKLFENERPGMFNQFLSKSIFYFLDEYNDENVPPINIRVDIPKDEPNAPPIITIKLEDRALVLTSHALDILQENLEEVHTSEEKSLRKKQAPQNIPIDIYLRNVQLTLAVYRLFFSFNRNISFSFSLSINIQQHKLLSKSNHR